MPVVLITLIPVKPSAHILLLTSSKLYEWISLHMLAELSESLGVLGPSGSRKKGLKLKTSQLIAYGLNTCFTTANQAAATAPHTC